METKRPTSSFRSPAYPVPSLALFPRFRIKGELSREIGNILRRLVVCSELSTSPTISSTKCCSTIARPIPRITPCKFEQ